MTLLISSSCFFLFLQCYHRYDTNTIAIIIVMLLLSLLSLLSLLPLLPLLLLLLWWWSSLEYHVALSFSSHWHNHKSKIFKYNITITTLCWSFRCHTFIVYELLGLLAILIHRTFGWGSQRCRLKRKGVQCPTGTDWVRWCMMAPGALTGVLDFEMPRNWCTTHTLIVLYNCFPIFIQSKFACFSYSRDTSRTVNP